MASDPIDFSGDLPDPGWRERASAAKRAAKALFETRVAIFREELAGKGSLLGQGAAALVLAIAFASLSLVLLTALVAAVLARLLGGAIAGLAATLLLYLVVAGGAAMFGLQKLRRLRPFDFPVTRSEVRKDLDALRDEGTLHDEGPVASREVLAAERASVRPGETEEEREERERADLEDRFRVGSE
jgi:uncharacterized membrane protein YqjE